MSGGGGGGEWWCLMSLPSEAITVAQVHNVYVGSKVTGMVVTGKNSLVSSLTFTLKIEKKLQCPCLFSNLRNCVKTWWTWPSLVYLYRPN